MCTHGDWLLPVKPWPNSVGQGEVCCNLAGGLCDPGRLDSSCSPHPTHTASLHTTASRDGEEKVHARSTQSPHCIDRTMARLHQVEHVTPRVHQQNCTNELCRECTFGALQEKEANAALGEQANKFCKGVHRVRTYTLGAHGG